MTHFTKNDTILCNFLVSIWDATYICDTIKLTLLFSLVWQTVQLRISVVESVPDGKLLSIGHVIVGSQLSGTELTHWNQMMTSLRKPVAMWHSLQK